MNRVYFDFIAGTTSLGRIEIELFFDITQKIWKNLHKNKIYIYNLFIQNTILKIKWN